MNDTNKIKDSSHRKYLLTINNPIEKGLDHENIKIKIKSLKGLIYYCMCDEIGLEEKTPHTHVYIYYKNPKRFSTLKNIFPEAHIDIARGTSKENRNYCRKEGKYLDDEKKDTNLIDTFEEEGDLPDDDNQGKHTEIEKIVELIENGYKVSEIIRELPKYALRINQIKSLYNEINQEKFKSILREDMEVIYVYGPTGSGKTSWITSKYGLDNISLINCNDNNAFDKYDGEEILVLDEFNSSFPITSMNQYLDIYPTELKARYNNKIAMYNKVIIISNLPLYEQYFNIQSEKNELYKAFCRRIHKVIEVKYCKKIYYKSVSSAIDSFFYFSNFSNENIEIILEIGKHAEKAIYNIIKDTNYKDYFEVYKEIIEDDKTLEFVNDSIVKTYKKDINIKNIIVEKFPNLLSKPKGFVLKKIQSL